MVSMKKIFHLFEAILGTGIGAGTSKRKLVGNSVT